MAHRFKLGDKARLNYGFLDQSGAGRYEVVRLIPVEVDGEPQYRVRGEDGVERAIGERQMVAATKDDNASKSD
jgi:hypothetical protein